MGGNSILVETAPDALKSDGRHSRAISLDPLKIRRYVAPWGFNSPPGTSLKAVSDAGCASLKSQTTILIERAQNWLVTGL
jgi:hypothetical protein